MLMDDDKPAMIIICIIHSEDDMEEKDRTTQLIE
jgi:hypothetical protein